MKIKLFMKAEINILFLGTKDIPGYMLYGLCLQAGDSYANITLSLEISIGLSSKLNDFNLSKSPNWHPSSIWTDHRLFYQ